MLLQVVLFGRLTSSDEELPTIASRNSISNVAKNSMIAMIMALDDCV